jgi:hypothetical protein
MAQSLYAGTSLLDLRYGLRNALTLFSLWLGSLLVPVFAYNDPWLVAFSRIAISAIFIALAGTEIFLHRRNIIVFKQFRQTLRQYVVKPQGS